MSMLCFQRTMRNALVGASLALLGIVAACDRTPEWPQDATWATYTNQQLGYQVAYPAACSYREFEGGTLFRFEGSPIMVVNYVTEDEGRGRGLWPAHQSIGEIELGGKKGQKFVYEHCDGPLCMHTVSYAVPHRGRFLGLEFRTHSDEPDALQQQILDSFAFLE